MSGEKERSESLLNVGLEIGARRAEGRQAQAVELVKNSQSENQNVNAVRSEYSYALILIIRVKA